MLYFKWIICCSLINVLICTAATRIMCHTGIYTHTHTHTHTHPLRNSCVPKLTVPDKTLWLCHIYSFCSNRRPRWNQSWRKLPEICWTIHDSSFSSRVQFCLLPNWAALTLDGKDVLVTTGRLVYLFSFETTFSFAAAAELKFVISRRIAVLPFQRFLIQFKALYFNNID